jgi:hypothetical protein
MSLKRYMLPLLVLSFSVSCGKEKARVETSNPQIPVVSNPGPGSSSETPTETSPESVPDDTDETLTAVWQKDSVKATFVTRNGYKYETFELDTVKRTLKGEWTISGSGPATDRETKASIQLTEELLEQLLSAVKNIRRVFTELPAEGEPTCTEGIGSLSLIITKKDGDGFASAFDLPPESQGCGSGPYTIKHIEPKSAYAALEMIKAQLPEPR